MNSVRIYQVDAFTRKPFSGNPAGVVLHADGLTSDQMQRIANEMNLSETVFMLEPETEDADLRIRWFTPTQEVSLCGHATIALFHVLAETGEFGLEVNEPQSFVVETKSGPLTIDLEWKDLNPYVKMSLPVPKFFPYPDDYSVLCAAIGVSEVELSQKAKPQITGDGYCYIPLANYDSLGSLEPNVHLMKKLRERHDLTGFAVVTTDTGDRDVDWHMRFFAPSLGVSEDPVTGSANGPMAAYLLENGLLDRSKKHYSFKGSQGSFIGRQGFVTVTMVTRNNKIELLEISGQAVTVLEGEMRLNVNIPLRL